jgi:uncharacterized protein (DUF885 family)
MPVKLIAALIFSLCILTGLSSAQGAQSISLHSWLDEQYDQELSFTPNAQTKLGRKIQYDELNDYSIEGQRKLLAWREASVASMKKKFSYAQLNEEERVSYDFWAYRLDIASAAEPWRLHDYAITQIQAPHTALPGLLINYHAVDTADDMDAYIKRTSAVAVAIDQVKVRAQQSAAIGVRPPQFAYDLVIDEAGRVISGRPFSDDAEDSALWRDARGKISVLLDAGAISSKQSKDFERRARNALTTDLGPAYSALINWLKQDRSNADAQAQGVHALPRGDEYYAYTLKKYTMGTLSAEQIHQLGLSEVKRIRAEMEAVKQAAAFKGELSDFFNFVRDDPQFYYSNDDAGRQQFIDETEFFLNRVNKRLPDFFGTLPKSPLVVRRVEAFREQDGAAAFYEEGTADGSRPGVYYMHLSDMSANNITDLQSTAYHEGNPGHHMQVAIAMENSNLPLFRRSVWYSAYGEGWALYSEQLAFEMGVYDNALYDFGRLVAEIFRAARLVVDTGIHAKGWTEEQAVSYMLANSSTPEAAVRSEIRRYTAWPAQATSYKIGMLKILELRHLAREQLGDKFDIRQFHDLILGGGSLPLEILERTVEQWTANSK